MSMTRKGVVSFRLGVIMLDQCVIAYFHVAIPGAYQFTLLKMHALEIQIHIYRLNQPVVKPVAYHQGQPIQAKVGQGVFTSRYAQSFV